MMRSKLILLAGFFLIAPVVRGAQAVIVVGDQPGPFYQYVADELQRYLGLLGVPSEIVEAEQWARKPTSLAILLGGPQVNSLVRQSGVPFTGLQPDGFVLWSARVWGRQALIVGGNDEASTMYAAYDLIERLGATFLLTKDILPPKKADLKLPTLQMRIETPFPRRGLLISNIYPNRSIWHLSEVKAFLDQMAKMKLNYLQFFWFEYEPWLSYSYRGENNLIGDQTGKETGYMIAKHHYGSFLVKDMPVGRDRFGGRQRMAPSEFQNVETPEQARAVAKKFLTEIIRYAKSRKISVWPAIDLGTLPPNLARYTARTMTLPFAPILGTHVCPANPETHEINESRLRALVGTYPDAEGYFLYLPEHFPDCPDEVNQKFLLGERPKYPELIKLWQTYNNGYERNPDKMLDSSSGSIHVARKAVEALRHMAPNAKVGIGGIGRGFLLPALDKLFPKDIPFTDMESRVIWTPQGIPFQYFGGMGERERTVVPRLDEDNAMFGPQFNVNLYYKDRVLEGSLENGVAGFAGQMNRARGTEQNARYLAEGAWQPHLTPKEFYAGYIRRIYGEAAEQAMLTAYEALEENEEALGWSGRNNFDCCGVIGEVSMAHGVYRQANPFDGPVKWDGFVKDSRQRIEHFSRSIGILQKALAALEKARPQVAPQGREEWAYLYNKTEAYILFHQTLVTARRAYIAYDEAFRLRKQDYAEFRKRLEASMVLFSEARRLGRQTMEKFAEIIDHPSDMGVLYRGNLFLVTGLEMVEQTMRNIVNFHHGRPYTEPVEWSRIYHDFPQFGPPR